MYKLYLHREKCIWEKIFTEKSRMLPRIFESTQLIRKISPVEIEMFLYFIFSQEIGQSLFFGLNMDTVLGLTNLGI